MRVLVTGGTGYIGAHCVQALIRRGDHVVVVDDVVSGRRDRVPTVRVCELDLSHPDSRGRVSALLREEDIDAVIHFAARKRVAESVRHPARYWADNLGGLAQLLLAMEDVSVDRLVFSSSAAVYGAGAGAVPESSPTRPLSPYGETKLAGERLVASATAAWGLRAASLRYFNVGGAQDASLGDVEKANLIPLVFDRLELGRRPLVFGDDYPTPDGSCVRDYVHVVDVAEAHTAVVDSLGSDPGHVVFNVGTGVGTSVFEMIAAIESATGIQCSPLVVERRPGDAPAVVADVRRIRAETGWESRFGVSEIVSSAWRAWGAQRRGSPTVSVSRTRL